MSLAVAALALGLAAPPAAGYEWYETDGGNPLRWFQASLTYRISTVEPEEVSAVILPDLFEEAFSAWMDIPGCAIPEVSFAGATEVTGATTPLSLGDPADNVMVFIRDADAWVAKGHSRTWIAITLIASNTETGEIVDADMEINDGRFKFSVTDEVPPDHIDLIGTLTHEAGHFLGLDHSALPQATMYATYDIADPDDLTAARTLDEDDRQGVCALYDLPFPCPGGCDDGDRCTTDSCTPGGVCAHQPIDGCGDGGGDSGCGTARASGGAAGDLALVLALGTILLARTRKSAIRPR